MKKLKENYKNDNYNYKERLEDLIFQIRFFSDKELKKSNNFAEFLWKYTWEIKQIDIEKINEYLEILLKEIKEFFPEDDEFFLIESLRKNNVNFINDFLKYINSGDDSTEILKWNIAKIKDEINSFIDKKSNTYWFKDSFVGNLNSSLQKDLENELKWKKKKEIQKHIMYLEKIYNEVKETIHEHLWSFVFDIGGIILLTNTFENNYILTLLIIDSIINIYNLPNILPKRKKEAPFFEQKLELKTFDEVRKMHNSNFMKYRINTLENIINDIKDQWKKYTSTPIKT